MGELFDYENQHLPVEAAEEETAAQTAAIEETVAKKTASKGFLPEKWKDRLLLKPVSEKSVKWPVLSCLLYWLLSFACWEILAHYTVFGEFNVRSIYAVGFTGAIACFVTLLTSVIPGKFRFWVTLVLSVVLVFLYGSQMVYEFIFGTLYSVAQMEIGGAALTSFWRETLATIWDKLPYLLVLTLPVIALLLLRKYRNGTFCCKFGITRLVLLLLALVLHMGSLLLLHFDGQGLFSDYYYYYSDTIATNQTAERFGILTTFRLETLGAYGGNVQEPGYFVEEQTTVQNHVEEQTEEAAEETAEPVYNVMEFDFDALNGKTEDEVIKTINDYCSQITGTKQNEYTGMLADYNLIVICAESFATGAIYPELMPTLHRLSTEGIVFNNFYNSFPNTTTDGEYALMQGLWPDSNREKKASSLYSSRNSYLPFTLGNLFMEQRGIQSYGYHNYEGSYYGRDESHPNMGYSMKFAKDGMKFSSSWPASDLEMMEQSIDDYIGMEQFHAYYMTFSGHYKYDNSNELVVKNWKLAQNLPIKSRQARAYISCNLELEYALSYLMERLEEAGVADKTAIVLVGDHYPYGLEDKEYSELVGYKIDSFSKYKSTLIFWVGGLKENIVVDEYCCNVDILPTILNLWGFEYDSRMLAGTDVFSDSEHVAVLVNKSFLTDKVWVDSNTGEIRYLVDESEIPAGYIENMHRMINNRFAISSDILGKCYYNFIFDKEMVKVPKNPW